MAPREEDMSLRTRGYCQRFHIRALRSGYFDISCGRNFEKDRRKNWFFKERIGQDGKHVREYGQHNPGKREREHGQAGQVHRTE